MQVYESKVYYCSQCGCALRFGYRQSDFAPNIKPNMLLAHDVFAGCPESGKFFNIPSIELEAANNGAK